METLSREHPISAVCLGIAGVDRPHDEGVIRGILRRLGHRETARVVNDAAIALVAGAPGRVGVVVLAGTGSISYGADRNGRTARAGGYGFLLADEGSGYWLGHQSLRATVRAADGRGPDTRLQELVFEALGVASVSELIPRVYEKGLPKHRIAALASLVQAAHDQGDAVAATLDRGRRPRAGAGRALGGAPARPRRGGVPGRARGRRLQGLPLHRGLAGAAARHPAGAAGRAHRGARARRDHPGPRPPAEMNG